MHDSFHGLESSSVLNFPLVQKSLFAVKDPSGSHKTQRCGWQRKKQDLLQVYVGANVTKSCWYRCEGTSIGPVLKGFVHGGSVVFTACISALLVALQLHGRLLGDPRRLCEPLRRAQGRRLPHRVALPSLLLLG